MAITDKFALNNRRPYKVKEDFSNDAQFSKFFMLDIGRHTFRFPGTKPV
jgi:hypothetical protein